jgi:hypothetical protein
VNDNVNIAKEMGRSRKVLGSGEKRRPRRKSPGSRQFNQALLLSRGTATRDFGPALGGFATTTRRWRVGKRLKLRTST